MSGPFVEGGGALDPQWVETASVDDLENWRSTFVESLQDDRPAWQCVIIHDLISTVDGEQERRDCTRR